MILDTNPFHSWLRITNSQDQIIRICSEPKLLISDFPYRHRVRKKVCCLVTKTCPALCNPMNYSPLGSSVHGISQARILEYVAISFSRGSSWPRDWNLDYILHWQADFLPLSLKICTINCILYTILNFPDSSVGKESAYNAGDPGSISEPGRSTGEGIGYPL